MENNNIRYFIRENCGCLYSVEYVIRDTDHGKRKCARWVCLRCCAETDMKGEEFYDLDCCEHKEITETQVAIEILKGLPTCVDFRDE